MVTRERLWFETGLLFHPHTIGSMIRPTLEIRGWQQKALTCCDTGKNGYRYFVAKLAVAVTSNALSVAVPMVGA